jgi:hypothetical protein
MNNGKQPITPTMYTKCGDGSDDYLPLKDGQQTGWEVKFGGLTKREYFALHLMQGLLSGADRHSQEGDCQSWNYEHLSKISIQAADALLEKLSIETQP